ncbi:deoxyguanosinetriphosphate triphosphohydrolase [Desulfohalovibrio reitneri]|uniref:deoxyguanosinetriphosphate triphosphohydrolase n=1 Tax=Desulfohalovibrio reitneri TaxID=1307759 RepID=UPI0004A6E88B|nr:deoxyguanosinetriphosphate triphosphohydrolase [Desulfohalovibrio reitneri]
MELARLLSPRRPRQRNEPEESRSEYARDHDRLLFSDSFRRLGRKTQVHPLNENDHIHTRLSHSLETASVGRSLGRKAGRKIDLPDGVTPEDVGEIVQAACLAHDIGNPPFGHAGEEAVRAFFRERGQHFLEKLSEDERADLLRFEGNAQGFRVVTRLELNLDRGGMRLTYPVLGALLKYPWTAASPLAEAGKCSALHADRHTLDEVASELGLPSREDHPGYHRHPLAWLVEAADDLCYSLLDLEDARELGLVRFGEIAEVLEPLAETTGRGEDSERRRLSLMRTRCIHGAVEEMTSRFADLLPDMLEGRMEGSLLKQCGDPVRSAITGAKDLAKQHIYYHRRKLELEIGSHAVLGKLLTAFCTACLEQADGSPSLRSQHLIRILGEHAPAPGDTHHHALLKALDYISGMTDHYARQLAERIG